MPLALNVSSSLPWVMRLTMTPSSSKNVVAVNSWVASRTIGKLQSELGSLEESETFAREAVALAEPTDWYLRAECQMTLAQVLANSGQYEEALGAAERALGLETRKGTSSPSRRPDRFSPI